MNASQNEFPNLPDVTQPLDVLVVAPHPDDAELGMGGAICKMLQQGRRVGIVDLTSGEPTPHGTPEIRAAETAVANAALGGPWRYNLGMKNRFLEATLENRHRLAGLFRLTRPRWIFAPYWSDAHPDHVAATELVEAAQILEQAYRKATWPASPITLSEFTTTIASISKWSRNPRSFWTSPNNGPPRLASIDAYQSQFVAGRTSEPPSFTERLREEAAFWGKAIGVRYGEPFASKEPIGMKGFDSLI